MNLNDLKNFKFDISSLKNFSWQDVRNFINEQQVLALNIVIVVGALFVAGFFFNVRIQEYSKVKQELSELESKEDPTLQYEKAAKASAEALASVPEALSEEQMISFIAQLAARHHFVIEASSPPTLSFKGFYKEMTIALTYAVPSFQDALFFVNALESSPHAFKVNSLSVRPKDVPTDQLVDLSAGLGMTIEISSIGLMDNGQKKPKKK